MATEQGAVRGPADAALSVHQAHCLATSKHKMVYMLLKSHLTLKYNHRCPGRGRVFGFARQLAFVGPIWWSLTALIQTNKGKQTLIDIRF
jgi:hypothetical protein